MYLRILFIWVWASLVVGAEIPRAGFALSEHLAAGQQVTLLFDVTNPGERNKPLHLPNGLNLSFGNILSLGDLCGIPGKPISLGDTQEERQQRFLNAFYSFAKNGDAVDEIKQLNQVIEKELEKIEAGVGRGETPESIYQRDGNEVGRQINCISGGGCQSSTWWMFPGRYLKLAMENYDHFVPNAKITYLTGHQVALKQAQKAHQTGLREDLELAYAMDAFACHFLSDHFAAGHIRTPRMQLAKQVSPALLGALLAIFMHNEENNQGVHVHNTNGEYWLVYGDFSYLNSLNHTNRQILERTLQQSVDAIFYTYYSGIMSDPEAILVFIPEADETKGTTNRDITPLFYWDEETQHLLRRQEISNLFDRNMTANWWGWSTLMELRRHHPTTKEMRAFLYTLKG